MEVMSMDIKYDRLNLYRIHSYIYYLNRYSVTVISLLTQTATKIHITISPQTDLSCHLSAAAGHPDHSFHHEMAWKLDSQISPHL